MQLPVLASFRDTTITPRANNALQTRNVPLAIVKVKAHILSYQSVEIWNCKL